MTSLCASGHNSHSDVSALRMSPVALLIRHRRLPLKGLTRCCSKVGVRERQPHARVCRNYRDLAPVQEAWSGCRTHRICHSEAVHPRRIPQIAVGSSSRRHGKRSPLLRSRVTRVLNVKRGGAAHGSLFPSFSGLQLNNDAASAVLYAWGTDRVGNFAAIGKSKRPRHRYTRTTTFCCL